MNDGRRRLVVDLGAGCGAIVATVLALWASAVAPTQPECYTMPPSRWPSTVLGLLAIAVGTAAGLGLKSRGGSRLHGTVGVSAAVAVAWAIVSLFLVLTIAPGC